MVLQVDEARVEARFGPFGLVFTLTQDRSIVYAEHNIGLEIFLDEADGTPR
jgi:hypothetical protein